VFTIGLSLAFNQKTILTISNLLKLLVYLMKFIKKYIVNS